MKVAIDLHIHSGLSPCANEDMTPNNIINMALLKRLDILAITDHNSTLNLESFIEVGKKHGILCIPGVEVTTREEVHLIVLFKGLNDAKQFQKILDMTLPKIKNNVRFFGNQYIYDDEDHVVEEYDILLMNSIELTVEETIKEVQKIGGIVFPAHIDRKSFSILTNLGFISPDIGFRAIEVTTKCNLNDLIKKHPYLKRYNRVTSSDAHRLGEILEREFLIDIKSISIEEVFKFISRM
ncbi:MAG: PHP domain-containing protein [Clostridiaceae bacterium]|nr:PHP domain-containing protein [Clostridiaceae bacterium]